MATHLVQEGFLEVSMAEECRKNPTGIRPRSVLRLDGQCCMCTRHTQAPCGRMDEACEQMQRFSWFHGQVYIQFLHTRPKDHAGKQLGALILEKGIVEHQAEETRRAQARLGSCQPGWRLGWGAWDKGKMRHVLPGDVLGWQLSEFVTKPLRHVVRLVALKLLGGIIENVFSHCPCSACMGATHLGGVAQKSTRLGLPQREMLDG